MALTVLGVVGNSFILGNQVQAVENKLDYKIEEVKQDMKEVKHDIKDLLRRQSDVELWQLAFMEKFSQGCKGRK